MILSFLVALFRHKEMRKKPKTICVIPARGGSKGLPGKNIKVFNGKPLIAWPIIAAKACKKIDEVVVTTDSFDIAEKAQLFGATVPALRPAKLAGDNTTTEDTLKYALNQFEESTNQRFDLCVFLTCTDIFRDGEEFFFIWNSNCSTKASQLFLQNHNKFFQICLFHVKR